MERMQMMMCYRLTKKYLVPQYELRRTNGMSPLNFVVAIGTRYALYYASQQSDQLSIQSAEPRVPTIFGRTVVETNSRKRCAVMMRQSTCSTYSIVQ